MRQFAKVTWMREPSKVTQQDKFRFVLTMEKAKIFILYLFTRKSEFHLKLRINSNKTLSLLMMQDVENLWVHLKHKNLFIQVSDYTLSHC